MVGGTPACRRTVNSCGLSMTLFRERSPTRTIQLRSSLLLLAEGATRETGLERWLALLLAAGTFAAGSSGAQQVVRGVVLDSVTKGPIPSVVVMVGKGPRASSI